MEKQNITDNQKFEKPAKEFTKKSAKKPILLCILDGWGIGDKNDPNNAIEVAKPQNFVRFLTQYPNSQLETSGLAVGLPENQMGNSEVGHMTIGAGRVIFQDLVRINNSISNAELEKNQFLADLIMKLKDCDQYCHLAGLLSDGGVHSHIDHLIFLADYLTKNGVKVAIHAFLDGRDVAQKSALKYLDQIRQFNIATISGRYYSMDRDKKFDRIKLATDAIISGVGEKYQTYQELIEKSYQNNITDEFIKPAVNINYQGIKEGDGLIFVNFRADRAIQISQVFATNQHLFSSALAMTEYSQELNNFYQVLFPAIEIKNSLSELISRHQLTQLRIAETEKYAHVTFFFSCGMEKEISGEERILIKSPNVATYDLQPEMSANEVSEKLISAINSDKFDFIVVNYANPDMVGHSGDLSASIKAVKTIDQQLGFLEKAILAKDGLMLITADHGNIECMKDEDNLPHTSHTTNKVPLILLGNDVEKLKLKNGTLADIAPTILSLMRIEKPKEMKSESLLFNLLS
jgi:2,3-bisphosphoglycerate-independent phosphoglycerate mutase